MTRSQRTYSVYVIELQDPTGSGDLDPLRTSVYVGQTVLTPRQRFEQHKKGIHAARKVEKYGVWLRPKLSRGIGPFSHRDQAIAAEARLGGDLTAKGYEVFTN